MGDLLAAAADPQTIQKGGHPYWLLRVRSKAYALKGPFRFADPQIPTMKKGTIVVRAQWYELTSSPREKRRSYKLLPNKVLVPVTAIIQEQDLDFMRGGSELGDCCFTDEMHARVMSHNLSNYT